MKKRTKHTFWFAFALALILHSTSVFAAGNESLNPLGINTIDQLVVLILQAVITVGLPLLVFFFLLTGFYFVTAQGNSKKLEDAQRMLKLTIYGAALILGAKVIHEVLVNTIAKLNL